MVSQWWERSVEDREAHTFDVRFIGSQGGRVEKAAESVRSFRQEQARNCFLILSPSSPSTRPTTRFEEYRKRRRNNAFRPRCLLQSRTRGNRHFFRRVVASCVERSKSRLLPRRPSTKIPRRKRRFSTSLLSQPILALLLLLLFHRPRASINIYMRTRRIEGFVNRVSIFHTLSELSFPIIPREICILPPFPGAERERATYREWRAHTRARKAARNLNGFRG